MQSATITGLASIGVALIIGSGPVGRLAAQSGQLPNCTGWSNCGSNKWVGPPRVCNNENTLPYVGPTVISDFSDGLSSDGRGPYVPGKDGAAFSMLRMNTAGFGLGYDKDSIHTPRSYRVNLNSPVPGGGAVPLGIITAGSDNMLFTASKRVGDISPGLADVPVGQTVTAAQMNVSFHIDGRFFVLQMGPQPLWHCHTDMNAINGIGTSSGTIYRASRTRWVIDLPTGSIGRLFDVSHTAPHAADRGLYYFHLHFEMEGIPSVIAVLGPLLETQGAAAVVARYRALKRDSAQAYGFASALNPIGYRLLARMKPQDAVTIFRLSAEENPGDWSPYDGLGQSYLALADTSKAIASFRRALELNPKNQDVADVFKRLGVKP